MAVKGFNTRFHEMERYDDDGMAFIKLYNYCHFILISRNLMHAGYTGYIFIKMHNTHICCLSTYSLLSGLLLCNIYPIKLMIMS